MRAASAWWFFFGRATALVALPAVALGFAIRVEAQHLFPLQEAISGSAFNKIPYHRAFACGLIEDLDLVAAPPAFTFTHATPERSESAPMLFARVSAAYSARGIGISPRMVVEKADLANAFVRDSGTIVVTTPLLNTIIDRSELAFIFAHEMAHIALKHGAGSGVRDEIAADKLALTIVSSLGLNPCAGAEVLDRLSAPLSATLVSISPRLDALHLSAPEKCG